MTKLPEMPHSRSRGSRSGVRLSIGRKRPRERRSVSGGNRQLQKPKELLRKPVGNTKPRSKRSKTFAPPLINDTRLRTPVGKSRKRNWRRDCAGRTISSLSPSATSLRLAPKRRRPVGVGKLKVGELLLLVPGFNLGPWMGYKACN